MATWKDYVVPSDEDAGKQRKSENGTKTVTVVEGTLNVLPDCDYASGQYHNLQGLGSVFNGLYKAKRVVHTIDSSGYKVEITERKQLSVTTTPGTGSSSSSSSSKTSKAKAAAEKNAKANKAAATSSKAAAEANSTTSRPKVSKGEAKKEEAYVSVNKNTGKVTFK